MEASVWRFLNEIFKRNQIVSGVILDKIDGKAFYVLKGGK